MLNMSETIKTRRRELGMTQEQLANLLGVSAPAVSKWEQGASYPDVTLLPVLARALHTDLNTLMDFTRAPDKAQITRMLTQVNDTAKEQGLDAGIALACEMVREYPSCGQLLFGLAATIDGRMMMAGMTGEERASYTAQVHDWYTRAADSDDPEARQAASHLLASYALNRGDVDAARAMMERLPQEMEGPTAARWPLDVRLMLARGEQEKAEAFLQKRLFARAADMQQMLLGLVQMAVDAGDLRRARHLAGLTKGFVDLMQMHPYTGHMAQLLPALAAKDAQESLVHIQGMLASFTEPWEPGACLMYEKFRVKKSGHVGHDMLAGILREMEESEEYAFLWEEAGFTALLAAYRGASNPPA